MVYLPAVPRIWFGSADCDTVYALYIYLSLCKQLDGQNHFRGTDGINALKTRSYFIEKAFNHCVVVHIIKFYEEEKSTFPFQRFF